MASLSSAVPISHAQSRLTFTQSINYLIQICLLVGYNLGEEAKYKIVNGILCGQALLASVFNLVYSYLKCELTSNDIQKLVASLEMITASISILLMNLQFRRSCRNLTTLMVRLDRFLMQFKGEEQPLLDRLRKMKPVLITIIIWPMLIFYYHEYMTNEGHVEFGSERFTRLSQRYHLRLIFNVWGRIPFSVTTLFLAIFICVFLALNLLIGSLAKKSGKTSDGSPLTGHGTRCPIDLNDVMEFMNLHRQTAQLLRLADQIFGPFFLVGICLLVIQSITYARVLTLPDQPIALGPMAVLISGCVNITVVIMLCSKINEKLRKSLNHLMELGNQLQADGQQTHRMAFALSSKIELYVTHVELDPPALSLGGVMTMRPQLIVEIAGFILSYTVFVYSK